jgi:ribosome-associated protein
VPRKSARLPASSPSDRNDLSLQRAILAAQAAADCRGQQIVILDMRAVSALFDFFVIASGTSRRQLMAMADEIDRVLTEKTNAVRLGIEGEGESRWILLDYGDLVVHLFDPETRAYYALEELWSDAALVQFEPPSPSLRVETDQDEDVE